MWLALQVPDTAKEEKSLMFMEKPIFQSPFLIYSLQNQWKILDCCLQLKRLFWTNDPTIWIPWVCQKSLLSY